MEYRSEVLNANQASVKNPFEQIMLDEDFCTGDECMAVYVNPDGSIVDGMKRYVAATRLGKPIRFNFLAEPATRQEVEEYLLTMPQGCSCGKR